MGKRGPAKTPTAILKLHGSRRAEGRTGEPTPPAGRPKCPTFLSPYAKTTWKALVPMLDQMGVLSLIDGRTLARYCELWAKWRDLAQFVQKNGTAYEYVTQSGESHWRAFPQAKDLSSISDSLLRLEKQFGLTPSARASLKVERIDSQPDAGRRFFG